MCNENRFSESGAPIAPTRCAEFARLKAQNEVLLSQAGDDAVIIFRLRTVLAPILAHAEAHDYAPPIRLSVRQCREMVRAINGND